MNHALALAVASLAFGLLCPREAAAFCRTTTCDPAADDACKTNDAGCIRDGVPLRWATSPIVFRFHQAGSAKLDTTGARKAIRKAFDAWSNVQCPSGRTSLRFEEQSDVTANKPPGVAEAAEKFGIYFRDDTWPHADANESIALTNQIYGKVSGNIDYADIEINTASVAFAVVDGDKGDIDLQAVMTHQVGHYIGLAHSSDKDSIMVARYCQAGNDRCKGGVDKARELSPDDTLAVCSAYPPGAVVPTTPTAPNPPGGAAAPTTRTADGCAAAATTTRPAEPVTLVGLGFLAIALVRRRARSS